MAFDVEEFARLSVGVSPRPWHVYSVEGAHPGECIITYGPSKNARAAQAPIVDGRFMAYARNHADEIIADLRALKDYREALCTILPHAANAVECCDEPGVGYLTEIADIAEKVLGEHGPPCHTDEDGATYYDEDEVAAWIAARKG